MRRLPVALVAVLAVSLFTGGTAVGSCVFPVLADQIQRAEVIAYGRVTAIGFGGTPLTFRPGVVYKGTLPSGAASVQIGPSSGAAATSVDYHAAAGTDQTLYLHRLGAMLATDSCSGSHEGRPTPQELAAFGPGVPVDSGTGPLGDLSDQPWLLPAVIAAVGALLLAVGARRLTRRRRTR